MSDELLLLIKQRAAVMTQIRKIMRSFGLVTKETKSRK